MDSVEFEAYLKDIKFEKHLKKLKKKLANKTVVLYGGGLLFEYIKEHYDLSDINVIGISDKKFTKEDEDKEHLGYKIITADKIRSCNPDCILLGVQNYINLLEHFTCNVYRDTNIKILALAQKSFWTIIKEIWF